MEKKVIVLTPNGRRQNVKVTPNTTLLQILEEVCQKHGFDSDEYGLLHHNKEVGLTQMFRFSGLPNNCLLEMTQTERKRVASTVDICVQLEEGARLQGQFVPSDSLWHVVEQLSAEAASTYNSPVAIYMRQEFIGKEQMCTTTLKSLGIIEGRAMIRFINKNPEELKTQANVYIAPAAKETPKSDDATPKTMRSNTGGGGFAITKDLVQSLKQTATKPNESVESMKTETANNADWEDKKTEKPKYDWGSGSGRSMRSMDLDDQDAAKQRELEAEMEIEPEVNIIGERNAIIYSMDDTQKQIEELPDSFFDLTVQDLKLVLRDLKRIASGTENAPLLTEKLRELEENKTMLNKIGQYKNCVIRVQFPDRYVLQGIFKPIDKIVNVHDFVRKFLQNQESKFYLFTIPPKTKLPTEKTLLELDFVPTAVVHFAWEEHDDMLNESEMLQNFVKAEYLQKLTTAEGALYAANKLRISKSRRASVNGEDNVAAHYEHKSPGPSTGAIPKRPRNDEFKPTTT